MDSGPGGPSGRLSLARIWSWFELMLSLREAPLLAIGDRERPPAGRTVRLTAMGEKLLAGQEDHVRLNGIDRWIGGVHLTSDSAPWRYDERLETLVGV